MYDTVPSAECRVPDWINETIYTRNTVSVSEKAHHSAIELQKTFEHYKNNITLFWKGILIIDVLFRIAMCC